MPSRKSAIAGRCFALFAALALTACPEDKIEVNNLFLEITSEAPTSGGSLERLRLLFERDGVHYPLDAADEAFNPAVGVLDPTRVPVLLSIPYEGMTFGDGRSVVVNITGWSGGTPQTRFEGTIDLTSTTIIKVRLLALPNACDVDNDGFLDCAVSGCCAEGSAFGDCDDTLALANPWATEAACEPCSDTVDQDCSGGDQPCVDTDNDQIADCAETCGKNDPKSGPGKSEICDGKDNDCDNAIDEGLFLSYGGQVLEKGQACGVGLCAGGVVECDGGDGLRCSSDNKRAAVEDCGTPGDDNCNGIANEGCSSNDFDGDGFATPADCNDFDAGVYPGRLGESCCPTSAQGDPTATANCDLNCDGDVAFCDVGDVDGDGITVVEGDCNDGDATIAPGKPERCGDGIDQDCTAGDLDCATVIDIDGDGWPISSDCNDGDPDVAPGAVEVCNGKDDDCNNMTDEGNPGGGAQCGTSDVGECAFGATQCQNSVGVAGTLVCVGAIDAAGSDVCDGKDEDCDGETDEDFDYLGQPIGAACDGVGGCGQGVVECAPGVTNLATCNTNPNGSRSGASIEVCDEIDNDCDGDLNEGLTNVEDSDCMNLGVCATNRQLIVATCTALGTWTCDYSGVPGYEAGVELSCDELDNNCDGQLNEGIVFAEPDGDLRPIGSGCDGADADQCANGIVSCHATDRTRTVCTETGGPQEELCDGVDNDCDGETDEDYANTASNDTTLVNALAAGDNGRFLGDSCGEGACGGGTVICGSTLTLKCSSDPRTPASPNAPIDVCDGVDNDCDGAVDEAYIAGGSVKLQNALSAADNGKVKDATCGSGECAGGTVICGSTTTLVCSTDVNGQTSQNGQTVAKTDTCNGKDDNCNGVTDDDFVATSGSNRKPLAGALFATDNGKIKGAACGIGTCLKDANGAASPGSVVCNAGGTALVCSSDVRATTDICDELDNDCDGKVDEPFTTVGGTTLAGAKLAADNGKLKGAVCGAGLCANGRVACAASKTSLVCNSESKAADDICDAIDNDCDGGTDEDFKYDGLSVGGQCDGVGACGAGVVVCALGSTTGATCSTNPNGTSPQVAAEVCDAQDNNCDGATDEGFIYEGAALGASCTGKGVCGAGTVVCSSVNNTTATCSTMPGGTQDASSPEICDLLDNNCDGVTNEGFTYADPVSGARALGQSCEGLGECAVGVVECASTSLATCSTNPGGSAHIAVAETCNGKDDDCDNVTDDDVVRDNCEDQDGVCAGAKKPASLCVGGDWLPCGAPAYAAHTPTYGAEICDNLDNDCDTEVDVADGDLVIPNCELQDGVCAGSTKPTSLCQGVAGWAACAAAQYEAFDDEFGDEVCDGLDNNCDSDTDAADTDAFVIPNCEKQDGVCAGSTKPTSLCNGLSGWGACVDATYEAFDADYGEETCDTHDNNCDGQTDAADTDDLVRPACQNQNGVCAGSRKPVSFCVSGSWVGVCGPTDYGNHNAAYGPEVCDGKDNDCDTETDAADGNFVIDPCEDQDGVCLGTNKPTSLCNGLSGWGACTATEYAAQRATYGDDVCDGLDNDCTGEADEAFKMGGTVDYDDPLYLSDLNLVLEDGCGIGDCDDGTIICDPNDTAKLTLACDTVLAHRQLSEACDDADDDCDGSTDEDFTSLAGALDAADNGKSKGVACGSGVCDPGDTGVVQCNADDTALECSTDDSADQTSETCNLLDDDCDGATDEGSPDEDGDGITACGDCNDEPGNAQDLDQDNICITGDRLTCVGGAAVMCDDNCPEQSNASQADANSNSVGDSCDPCSAGLTEPFEVCGDCLDNDCDAQADAADSGGCVYRRIIGIETDTSGVERGHSIALVFDHQFLVGSLLSNIGGDDVRIYYRNPDDGSFTEIARALDPESGWNRVDTKIWFMAQAPIMADVSDSDAINVDYYLYAGVVGSALSNESNVFHFADFFNRANSATVGPAGSVWTETETTEGLVSIAANKLHFEMENQADEKLRPIAYRTFGAITANRWLWRTKWNWSGSGDTTFALFTQLGDSGSSFGAAPAVGDTYPVAGVGPVVLWSRTSYGSDSSNDDLGVTNGTAATQVVNDWDGSDLVSTIVDFDAKTYQIDPDGELGTLPLSSAFAFNNSGITKLDAIRMVSHDQDLDNFTERDFDYVIIQRRVPAGQEEPVAYLGVREPHAASCRVRAGAISRWYLDDDRDDALGEAATVLTDSGSDGTHLTRTEVGLQPSFFSDWAQHGLSWPTAGANGVASASYSGTDLESSLDGARALTLEFVVEIQAIGTDAYIMNFRTDDGSRNALAVAVTEPSEDTYRLQVNFNNGVIGTWTIPLTTIGRTVFTVVIDTAEEKADNRLKLYRDGLLTTLVNASTPPALNDTLNLGTGGTFYLGNSADGISSPAGYVYYSAVYAEAMEEALVKSNAQLLRANDDRR